MKPDFTEDDLLTIAATLEFMNHYVFLIHSDVVENEFGLQPHEISVHIAEPLSKIEKYFAENNMIIPDLTR